MTEKPKVCPFCGGMFSLDSGLEEFGLRIKTFYIRCPFCEAHTTTGFSVEEAVAAWNMRFGENDEKGKN